MYICIWGAQGSSHFCSSSGSTSVARLVSYLGIGTTPSLCGTEHDTFVESFGDPALALPHPDDMGEILSVLQQTGLGTGSERTASKPTSPAGCARLLGPCPLKDLPSPGTKRAVARHAQASFCRC